MRWFKHMAHSHLDESLCRVMDEFGLEGYGAYWLVLESIAAQCDSDDKISMTLSVKNWRKIVPFAPQKLTNWFAFAGKFGLFEIKNSESCITVSCPKLLKYRDEYHEKRARKSGHSPDNVPVEQSRVEQTRTEDIKDTPKSTDLGAAKPKKARKEKADPRPNACPPERWEKYLTFSRNFQKDRAATLGNIAPFTEAKVVKGAQALDTLVRIRGVEPGEIQAVLAWAQGDSFWNDNIRALGSLLTVGKNGETKYSNMLAAMRRDVV
jgi:hypothetical protein